MNTEKLESAGPNTLSNEALERAPAVNWGKVILNAIVNALVFATFFGVGLRYLRLNPEWLHKAMNATICSIECSSYSEVSICCISFGIIPLLKLFLIMWFTAPFIYVFYNVFQPRLSHVLTEDAIAHIREYRQIRKVVWDILTRKSLNLESIGSAFPVWLSAIFGVFLVFVADVVSIGVFPNPGSTVQWVFGLMGAVVIVTCYNNSINQAESPKSAIADRSICDMPTDQTSNKENATDEVERKSPFANRDNDKRRSTRTIDDMPDDELLRWLESDEPSDIDLFGTRLAAKSRQLKDLILNRKSGQKIQSIGVVGKHGAGKSSMIKFLEQELQDDPKFIFCRVSTWRFDESASAIQHILSEILREVSKHIDTFRVRKLPDTFRKGFSSFGGEILDKLSDMLFGDESLKDRLGKLDRMVHQAGKTIVLVVEDLDRDSDTKFDSGQVQAFLHMLKQYSSVVSIIAAGEMNSTRREIDFMKLCDFKVDLHMPETSSMGKVIRRLKSVCKADEPPEIASYLVGQHGDFWRDVQYLDPARKCPSLIRSIALMLQNPRRIKHVMRRTVKAIQDSLRGEVDWDHLFLLNVVREYNSDLVGFLDQYHFVFSRLRRIKYDAASNTHTSIPERDYVDNSEVGQLWKTYMEQSKQERWVEIVLGYIVVSFPSGATVFPYLDSNVPVMKPQGYRSHRHWKRILDESLEIGDISDSVIVKDHARWMESKDSTLISMIVSDSRYCEAWIALCPCLVKDTPSVLRELFVEIVKECCNKCKMESVVWVDSIGLVVRELFFYSVYKQETGLMDIDSTKITQDFECLIDVAANSSLQICGILNKAAITLLIDHVSVYDNIRSVLKNKIKACLNKVDSDRGFIHQIESRTLVDLFNTLRQNLATKHPATHDCKDWNWIGPYLLKGIKEGHESTIKAVYHLVVSPNDDTARPDESILSALFGTEEAQKLINVLSQYKNSL